MSKHGEPWKVVRGRGIFDSGDPPEWVASTHYNHTPEHDTDERLVDCVNACAGVVFSGYNERPVRELVEAAEGARRFIRDHLPHYKGAAAVCEDLDDALTGVIPVHE